jgi:hypothetical protein
LKQPIDKDLKKKPPCHPPEFSKKEQGIVWKYQGVFLQKIFPDTSMLKLTLS